MLLDTSAWVELLTKAERWEKVDSVLDSEHCQTSMASLAEVYETMYKKGYDPKEAVEKVMEASEVVDLSAEISMLAGQLNIKRKMKNRDWGMMDSFVLATAMLNDSKILTKDTDFKGLENVELL
ncbi:MAG TPA: PIN domain-containing protein [Candidatus Acidoferrum sp.]|nr:PIN domain-containing protein [Candidatus Acidoferrum sp.]